MSSSAHLATYEREVPAFRAACPIDLVKEPDFEGRVERLSDALFEVLSLTAQGYLNKQIAWLRGSREGTVKSQQQEILRRLGLTSRTQAAVHFAIYLERRRNKPT